MIRVLVVAASAVRRAGLEALVKNNPEFKLLGSLPNIATIAQHTGELQIDVVVLDLQHPAPAVDVGVPLIALIDAPHASWSAQALRSGYKAILPRESGMEDILQAVRAAHAGLVLLDPEVTHSLAAQVRNSRVEDGITPEELTAREIEVLRMIAEGMGNREMALAMGISEHTVKFHVSSILDKLGAATRTEAVTLGIRRGIILI